MADAASRRSPTSISLECLRPCRDCAADSGGQLRSRKRFSFAAGKNSYDLGCAIRLSCIASQGRLAFVGVEFVLNLLAPNEPDRYFEIDSARHPLSWSVTVPVSGSKLRVVDEWQNIAAIIEAPSAGEFWITPIETISESEEGFERVYQGSQILAVMAARSTGRQIVDG